MYSTERGTNTREAMKAGEKMILVRIINIDSEMIGIGRPKHSTESKDKVTRIIIEKLQETDQVTCYLIIIQFWVSTGEFSVR